MRIVSRLAVLVLAIIGVINGIVVNVLVTVINAASKMLGGTGDPSKGLIGALLLLLALVGGFVALRFQVAGGVMLVIAGIGFFFIVHWWALLVSPSWLVGGALAIAENYDEAQRRIEGVNTRLASQSASPALPAATAPLSEHPATETPSEAPSEAPSAQAAAEASAPAETASDEAAAREAAAREAETTEPEEQEEPMESEAAPVETSADTPPETTASGESTPPASQEQ
jgi:hypothetical protein